MRRPFFFPLLLTVAFFSLTAFSCDSDGDGYNDHPGMYSPETEITLSEIVFFLQPYTMVEGERKYIVSEKITDITLKINNKFEKVDDSFALDVDKLNNTSTAGDYIISPDAIKYPAVIDLTITPNTTISTAGEFADLLSNQLTFLPGSYICQIVSFDLSTASGGKKTIYTPTLSTLMTVDENMTSAYLGEFEVEVK